MLGFFGFTCTRKMVYDFFSSSIDIDTKTFSKKFLESKNTWGPHLNTFWDLEKPC